MSAHPPSNYTKESGSSFWPLANIILAVLVGGFAFYWGIVLFFSAIGESAGWKKKEVAKGPPVALTAREPGENAPSNAAAAPTAPSNPGAPAATATNAASTAPAAGAAVAEVLIKPDSVNPLAYDTKEFTVKAGQTVRLTFNNTHPAVPQPHNIVIGAAGSKDKLLSLSMQMATSPDGMAKGFIPDAPEVLFHTKLLQPNTTETLEFTAPAMGEYPYICTFPGHGAIMNGVMKVVQ